MKTNYIIVFFKYLGDFIMASATSLHQTPDQPDKPQATSPREQSLCDLFCRASRDCLHYSITIPMMISSYVIQSIPAIIALAGALLQIVAFSLLMIKLAVYLLPANCILFSASTISSISATEVSTLATYLALGGIIGMIAYRLNVCINGDPSARSETTLD